MVKLGNGLLQKQADIYRLLHCKKIAIKTILSFQQDLLAEEDPLLQQHWATILVLQKMLQLNLTQSFWTVVEATIPTQVYLQQLRKDFISSLQQ